MSNELNIQRTLIIQKQWLLELLRKEEEHIQYERESVQQIYINMRQIESQIQNETDSESINHLRLILRFTANQAFRAEANLENMEFEYQELRNDLLYDISSINMIIGDF